MAREVIFLPEVADYLEELVLTLYEQGYFGFKEACRQYVDRLADMRQDIILTFHNYFIWQRHAMLPFFCS
jgi:predicted transcriptional regulator YheO